jgi:predicted Rossmann fold nucleotide-binding protein DprA/Smf involved in DNA uptake
LPCRDTSAELRTAGKPVYQEGAILTTCAAISWRLCATTQRLCCLDPQLRRCAIGKCPHKPLPATQAAKRGQESLDFAGEATEEIMKLLSLSPIDIDELCRLSGLEARQVSAALLSLDLSGRIEWRGLRHIALRP